MIKLILLSSVMICSLIIKAQVTIKIDSKSELKSISPYIYGRNNSISSTNPNWTIAEKDLIQIRDAGVTFFRESGGNNCTKYNWRKKLSSHPDWYNNVYSHDWGSAAKTIQKNLPNAQGMWSFQLIGQVAKTNLFNFNDYGYNKSQWWEGVNQNLAGNGVLNTTGTKAKIEGDPNLYLENWNADSTTAILDYWFGKNGLGLDKEKIKYWNMDNEPEIWNGTHDDIMPKQLTAAQFITKYVEVAKAARSKIPSIKLVGPVTANEWQWYNWDNNAITTDGKNYCWLEYFIKSIASEQKKSGVKLLDVLDLHFYPSTKKVEEIVQLHRIFFDRNFVNPEANGVKRVSGSWDINQNKEYIFGRINDWLNQYFGANHGITLALTEAGVEDVDANATAIWYASTMGEFMKNRVEIFTPWSWKVGMWETLHLFSKYNKNFSMPAESSNEVLVSSYPSINSNKDSMTIVLINRSPSISQNTTVEFSNWLLAGQEAKTLTLKSLSAFETFISNTQNALLEGRTSVANNKLNINLAPMSITTVLLTGKEGQALTILANNLEEDIKVNVFPNPSSDKITILLKNNSIENVELIDINGKIIYEEAILKNSDIIEINHNFNVGTYFLKLISKNGVSQKKITIEK